MDITINDNQGNVIRYLEGQEKQVYQALYKWADRLNKWEYNNQVIRNKGKKLKHFSPNATSLLIIESMGKIGNGLTPEQAMSILHNPSVRAELNMCMQAGF